MGNHLFPIPIKRLRVQGYQLVSLFFEIEDSSLVVHIGGIKWYFRSGFYIFIFIGSKKTYFQY